MKIITGFDSEPEAEEEKKEEVRELYSKVLGAIAIEDVPLEIVENAFARAAKKQFVEALRHLPRKKKSEVADFSTYQFSESALVVRVEDATEELLVKLVGTFGEYILSNIDSQSVLILVESLNTRIMRMQNGFYQFRIKQGWIYE